MTKQEIVKLFMAISAAFPRDEKFAKADPLMVGMWHKGLEDIPYEDAEKAVIAAMSTREFPPGIASIRDYATRLNSPRRITAEEAWGLAQDAMRTYGLNTVKKDGFVEKPVMESTHEYGGRTYRTVTFQPTGLEYEAKRHVPPDVWELMSHFGYRDMYLSENPDVVRGQFMRAWNSHDEEAKEARVIGGVVPELVAAITNQVIARLEEGSGEA